MGKFKAGSSGTHTIYCPQCEKEIDAPYQITPYYPERGESGFSLGQPAEGGDVEWDGAPDTCPDCGQDLTGALKEAESAVYDKENRDE